MLEDYLDCLGSGAVVKCLGYLVETMELDIPDRTSRLSRWQKQISAGISDLDPSSRCQPDRIVTRWGIGVNVDEVSLAMEP